MRSVGRTLQVLPKVYPAVPQHLIDCAASEESAAVPVSIYISSAFGEPNLGSYQIVRDAIEQLGYGS
jgi:hypothetical protein